MSEQEERKMKIKRAKVIQYMVPFAVRLYSMPDKNVTVLCIFLPDIVYMTCIKLRLSSGLSADQICSTTQTNNVLDKTVN